MIDEVLQIARQELGHVFWIGGTGCSGKSSIASLLGSEFALRVYHVDDEVEHPKPEASLRAQRKLEHELWHWLSKQPAQLSATELAAAITDDWQTIILEQTITHLLTLPRDRSIIVEGLFLPASLLQIAARDHIAVLIASRAFRAKYFAYRYAWFEEYANQVAMIDTVLDTLDAMDRRWTAQAQQFNVRLLNVQSPPDISAVSAQLATYFLLV